MGQTFRHRGVAYFALWLAVVGGMIAAGDTGAATLPEADPAGTGPVARWFMPGELGREPGRTPPPLSPRAFLTRAMSGVGKLDPGGWAAFNRLTPALAFSHNLGRVFPPALHAAHPEFFPAEAGKRICPPAGSDWWNPDLGREDVAAHAAAAADAFFDANPKAVSFALGTNDGLIFGDSPETRAWTVPVRWFRDRPDYSNLVFTFMNRVAKLTARKHPDKYLGALAYYWAENAPDFPVDPHVIPFLTADRAQGYDPAFVAEDQALQRRWMEALRAGRSKLAAEGSSPLAVPKEQRSQFGDGGADHSVSPNSNLRTSIFDSLRSRLGLYDYIYGSGFLVPRQFPHLLAENLRSARRLGVTDYYAEVYANWGLDGPQPWLVAQLLQDPEQSVERLLGEYFRRYYKEAARPMQWFYRRCEEQWMRQEGQPYWLKFYRNEHQAILFPPAVCRELQTCLAWATAVAENPVVQARVRQVRDAFGVTERFVAMETAREQLARAALQGEAEPKALRAQMVDFRWKRAEFVRYTVHLQASQPLLIAPFKMDDYLLDDPAVTALAKLSRTGGRAETTLRPFGPGTQILWEAMQRSGPNVIRNGDLAGPLMPPRSLGNLAFEVALPTEWVSTVEPAERFQATFVGGADRRLRLTGCRNTAIYQWNAVNQAAFALAGVRVRGQLSAGAAAFLSLSWMDAQEHHLKILRMALPPGEWPDWVELSQGSVVPAGAAWVGIGVTVTNQADTDWLEVKSFELHLK